MTKLNLNRVPMPKKLAAERRHDFEEVALGYTPEMAFEEASRCLQCPRRPCVKGCPVNIDIPGFILAICENDLEKATKIIKDKNPLPAICGRVCPQDEQCERACVLAKKGAPVAIGRLERFVADWELRQGRVVHSPPVKSTGKKVAVVGSGPAGLACAAQLSRMGHSVTIYEALHKPGGVLIYGIPEFRLPKSIVEAEVEYVKSLGVEIRTDMVVGRMVTVDELLEKYNAVFLGTGAGLPLFLNIPGENLTGIYSANEFLIRINLMKAYLFPEYDTPIKRGKKVVVIGGGNVAIDAARSALRLGAEVWVLYRRTKSEMPARREEVENAEEEGVNFKFLTSPVRFLDDGKGRVGGILCQEMVLGPPDKTGRRRPIPKGSQFVMEADMVITAIGTTPNPIIPRFTPGLKVSSKGTVIVDKEWRTTKPRVWAGGDIVSGAATIILAAGAGQNAALSIDREL